eukprot:g62884.t1
MSSYGPRFFKSAPSPRLRLSRGIRKSSKGGGKDDRTKEIVQKENLAPTRPRSLRALTQRPKSKRQEQTSHRKISLPKRPPLTISLPKRPPLTSAHGESHVDLLAANFSEQPGGEPDPPVPYDVLATEHRTLRLKHVKLTKKLQQAQDAQVQASIQSGVGRMHIEGLERELQKAREELAEQQKINQTLVEQQEKSKAKHKARQEELQKLKSQNERMTIALSRSEQRIEELRKSLLSTHALYKAKDKHGTDDGDVKVAPALCKKKSVSSWDPAKDQKIAELETALDKQSQELKERRTQVWELTASLDRSQESVKKLESRIQDLEQVKSRPRSRPRPRPGNLLYHPVLASAEPSPFKADEKAWSPDKPGAGCEREPSPVKVDQMAWSPDKPGAACKEGKEALQTASDAMQIEGKGEAPCATLTSIDQATLDYLSSVSNSMQASIAKACGPKEDTTSSFNLPGAISTSSACGPMEDTTSSYNLPGYISTSSSRCISTSNSPLSITPRKPPEAKDRPSSTRCDLDLPANSPIAAHNQQVNLLLAKLRSTPDENQLHQGKQAKELNFSSTGELKNKGELVSELVHFHSPHSEKGQAQSPDNEEGKELSADEEEGKLSDDFVPSLVGRPASKHAPQEAASPVAPSLPSSSEPQPSASPRSIRRRSSMPSLRHAASLPASSFFSRRKSRLMRGDSFPRRKSLLMRGDSFPSAQPSSKSQPGTPKSPKQSIFSTRGSSKETPMELQTAKPNAPRAGARITNAMMLLRRLQHRRTSLERSESSPSQTSRKAFSASEPAIDVAASAAKVASGSPAAKAGSVEEKPSKRLDGGTYTGDIVDGKAHGWGTWIHPEHGSYEGEFQHDYRHGHGTFYYRRKNRDAFAYIDGAKFVGSWKKGNCHGNGVLAFKDGSVYEGKFQDSLKHGRGMYKWPNGSSYEGNYNHGVEVGPGIMVYPDKTKYIGQWNRTMNGHWHGIGVFFYADGRKFSGSFVNNVKHGLGTLSYPDDKRRQGEWVNGKLHGPVVVTYPDGRVLNETWLNGKKAGSNTQGHT